MNTARWLVCGVAALALSACMSDDKGNGPPVDLNGRIQGAITLETFADCDALEGYLKDLAKQQIELQAEAALSGGCWGCGYGWATPAEVPASDNGSGEPSGGGQQPGSDKAAGVDYSTTNTQEEGVDEADFVKTDGTWLYLLRGGALVVVSTDPAEEAAIVSTTEVEGRPLEMFLDGDRVVVFSTQWVSGVPLPAQADPEGPKAWNDRLRVTVVDVSDRAAPVVERELLIEGSYVSSRLVDHAAYVVANTLVGLQGDIYAWDGGSGSGSGGSGGGGVPTDAGSVDPRPVKAKSASTDPAAPDGGVTPSDATMSDTATSDTASTDAEDEWKALVEQRKAEAIALVDAMALDELVPLVWEVTRAADGTEQLGQAEPLSECGDFYRPTLEYGPNMVSVLTLRLDIPEPTDRSVTIVGNGQTVYASAERLYLAADIYNGWYAWYPDKQEDWQWTVVHAFDLGVDQVAYAGSGKVEGRVLNQFSLGEHEGLLRVASTKDLWTQSENASESMVTVLGLTGGELTERGKVTGLGKGERIYSARFIGERGFVVTFEQVDPLYTIDLSDPTAPKVAGELKIPGFSTYIHPVGEDHLLTIGRDTFVNDQWVQLGGVQLSLFDVSDLTAPALDHKTVIGGSGTHSDALYDHKAFTYMASRGLLAVPLTDWGSGTVVPGEPGEPGVEPGDKPTETSWFAGAAVYDVSVETGFSERGLVDHTDFMDTGSWWMEHVSRAVVIGEHIYTIGELGLKVSRLSDLEEVASIELPPPKDGGVTPPRPGGVPVE